METNQIPRVVQLANAPEDKEVEYDFEATNPILRDIPNEIKKFVQMPQGKLEDYWIKGNSGGAKNCLLSSICCCYAMAKMVIVPDGEIGLSWYGNEPHILGSGRHFLWAPSHSFVRSVNLLRQKHIQHGSIHIISVRLGEVGLAVDAATGEPIILTCGQHYIDSITFEFKGFSRLETRITEIGELKMIRVEIGEIGYGYRSNGELMLLKPGMHLVKPPDRFEDILSLLVEIVNIPRTMYESKDYVQIAVSAGIYFQIRDPVKALTVVGPHVKRQIRELGAAALQQIIRSSTLIDIAGSEKVSYKQDDTQPVRKGEPDFYTKMHDEFMSRLHDHILEEWGAEINNIRIENLQIADRALAGMIAQQAVEVSKQEAEHMMLEKQTQIIETRANNHAKEIEIQTRAQAEKIKALAQAEADAVIIKARALKTKKELQGQGEAEYARLLQESGLGSELATLKIHQEALNGVKQVVYVPHLPKMLGGNNPLMIDSEVAMPKLGE
jgi:regulator of protease activity HflC (stomatin/prohibitin superfamily)